MNEPLARWLYSTALRAVAPAYLLRLWWRGRHEPGYRVDLPGRLGLYRGKAPRVDLWIHAVSLGETLAAAPLVQALRALHPGLRMLVTHGTATGREAAAKLLGERDTQAWLPYDTPGAVRRFLRHHRPRLGVLMETEVWPNLLHEAQQQRLPMVLANARLSERSLAKGQRLGTLMHPAAARLRLALAQTETDAQRLRQAGAPEVRVLGNLKFDITPDATLLARGRQWRQALARPVVLAAVTREGEEAALLQAWAQVPTPRPLLLLVPRHPQRFDEVAGLVAQAGFSLARRSSWQEAPPAPAAACDVWLGDSMREMALYYAMAEVALLGGSFEPLGGQNLIEAAACGCPLVMGPHTFNFAQAAEGALAAGAAERVDDVAAAVAVALQWLADPQRPARAERGLAFAAEHRGAAHRTAQTLLQLMA